MKQQRAMKGKALDNGCSSALKRNRGAQPSCKGTQAQQESNRGANPACACDAGDVKRKKTASAMQVNDPTCSDVEFVTKDGDSVWASRAVLAKASPLFSAMLTNGITRDSTSSSVPLPSIPTAALLPILEYLYTGSPCLSRFPLSILSAPLVLDAARFLLLSSLEESIASFFADSLRSLLSKDSITSCAAAVFLSQALDMPIPHTHDVLSKLKSLISDPRTLEPNTIARFSQQALCFYLEKTRVGSLRFDASEYSRLRCVLLWCATSIESAELTELLCKYLPMHEELALSAARDQSTLVQKLKLICEDLKSAFEPWLSHLDLFRIHPDVLTEVVLPLDIIPHLYLMHVLAFQVRYSKDMIFLRWKKQSTPEKAGPMQMSVLDQGHSIRCCLKGDDMTRSFMRRRLPGSMSSHLCMPPRFARAEMLITQALGIHEWDFVVEKESPFLALGFCSEQALLVQDDGPWLGYQPFGWVLYSTGQLFHGSKVGAPYGASFGAGSRIRVHVDMVDSTCKFTVNDHAYGIAWKGIPDAIYPAAALTFPGKVRIEAASNEQKKRLFECLDASVQIA